MKKKLKMTEEVKFTRQRERRNVGESKKSYNNSFTFFCLVSSYSILDNNKLTSVPDLKGLKYRFIVSSYYTIFIVSRAETNLILYIEQGERVSDAITIQLTRDELEMNSR